MQTRPEAPIEENLTPAQQSMQADPQDASATVGIDALESAVEGNRIRRPATQAPPPPGLTLYVGNLYYEVTEDQLKRIFSRFGEVKSVKLVMDNRGLSRG
jgi:RNA recognition motif-containing protein